MSKGTNDQTDSCALDDDTCRTSKTAARGLFPRTIVLHELMGVGRRLFQRPGDDQVAITVIPRDRKQS